MPCYTIRQTPITFEELTFKPGHIELMIQAIQSLGYEISRTTLMGDVVHLDIFPRGAYPNRRNTITYERGSFQVPSTVEDFTVDRVQNAYGMAAAKLAAKRNGWLFKQTSDTEFEFVRR